MIRTTTMTMLAVGFFALTGISAMAATEATHRHGKAAVVAQVEGTAPASDATKPQKKVAKKAKGTKAGKDTAATTDGASAGAPASEKMPEKK